MTPDRINTLKEFYRSALLDDVVPFWQTHGVDREFGGFYTCLDRDGSVYSMDKSVWFAGRATWMYAALCEHFGARREWLELAQHGRKFLEAHCFNENGKMYFSLDRQGRPLQMRRYLFSEVFATLAYAQLAKVTGDATFRNRAIEVYRALKHGLETPGFIPPKIDPDTRPSKGLSPLMCMISVSDALCAISDSRELTDELEQSITAGIDEVVRDFADLDTGFVLETVAPHGSPIDAPEGRVMNPGHAIETAWFFLEIARRRNDRALVETSTQMLRVSLERGWDHEHGGLLYFIDIKGKPPPYLEHDMKLWWPHCEALYATLLTYHLTGQTEFSDWFERIHEYTMNHFPDKTQGEWFGYLHRDGTPSSTLKGSMWKGPFHVPRALMLCCKLLNEMGKR